jgi:hypothetical protein
MILVGRPYKYPVVVTKSKEPLDLLSEGRLLDIKTVLIHLLLQLIDGDLIKLDKPEIEIPFADWWDEAPALNNSFLAWMINLVYVKELYTSKATFTQVTKGHPWLLGFFDGTTETLEHFRQVEGKMLTRSMSFTYQPPHKHSIKFTFKPKIGKCDHSGAQKADGNNVGGHFRCSKCGASFEKTKTKLLFQYTHMLQTPRKGLNDVNKMMSEHVSLKNIGMCHGSALIQSHPSESLDKINLDEYEVGPDNLHNGKGVAKQSLDVEREQKGWNELVFL